MGSRTERRWGLAGWTVVALVAVGVVTSFLTSQPQRAIGCFVSSRDGWEIEHPREPTTEAQYRAAVEAQTRCVPIDVVYVNRSADTERDGWVVRPIGTRSWVAGGGRLTVLVEAAPGPGVVGCGEPIVGSMAGGGTTELLTCEGDNVDLPPDLPDN